MIPWLLLVPLLCGCVVLQLPTGVSGCGPQNLTLATSEQMILVTWEDDPSCSAVRDALVYELAALVADKRVHDEEVTVTPDQIGSTHSWNWTSYLALECASHSVRLRSLYKNHTSPWKQEQLLPDAYYYYCAFAGIENSKVPEVFPRDKVFEVGSTVTFCCVLPVGKSLDKMYLSGGYDGANMNTSRISNRTYALTVHLSREPQHSCTHVKCQTETSDNGACAYIGYPPGDRDLQCETRDLESVDCHWTVGIKTHLRNKRATVYQLLGRPCVNGSEGRCSQKVQVDVGERTWTLTAQNELGKVELPDIADLTKRVHMFAPEGVKASTVNARDVSLKWGWRVQRYTNLNITCQVNVSHGDTSTTSEHFGVGLKFAVLNDLIPNWTYNVTVRCGTTQHLWKWSDWSSSGKFRTRGDVPDALDVWMHVMDDQIIIAWKMPLANQSHGNILDYEVTWTRTAEGERQNRTTVANAKHSLPLSRDRLSPIVTVTARNINGSSSPSSITIPSLHPDGTRVNTSRIIGSKGSFDLSWSASPTASCGYVVDWCPTSGHCSVEWLKVPPNETKARIFSENLSDGVRYSLSIFACTQGAPVLLDRREGYVSEKRIEDGLFKSLKWKQSYSDVEVSWDRIPLGEQSAFIQGYVLYILDNNSNVDVNVSEDPEATSLTARNLKIGTYTFTVKARTALGECGTSSITATLNSQTDDLIKAVVVSLVITFCLLSFITILCYRHWTCIKQKVYPPIPKPVLDKWLTSPGEHNCRPLPVDQGPHSQADITDVPELICITGALVNGHVSQENTPKDYYSQPLKKRTPPPLTLPTTAIPSPSGLPLSVFPNPSYNLIMQAEYQQSNPGPERHEGTPLERSSSGYQAQSNTEASTINQTEEDPESPMSCVSTYILLPQSPSK
ncbi:leukemia inhibitory factor receptor-like [Enoplosus armatus]|uniref:leukemia inhibitory factor receptor-like n=1 Tax=Enoplosus armatus TaxID=215367 RepID=UPI0039923FF1